MVIASIYLLYFK